MLLECAGQLASNTQPGTIVSPTRCCVRRLRISYTSLRSNDKQTSTQIRDLKDHNGRGMGSYCGLDLCSIII